MTTMLLALSVFLGSPLAALQQDVWSETSFHRIHLRNGNFIDGKVIADKPNEVILLLKAGEMSIRRDQVEAVEIIKVRSINEKPIILKEPKPPGNEGAGNPGKATPVVQTPEQIKRKVDVMILRLSASTAGEKEFNIQELQALGEDGAAYLATKAPSLVLKMQDAVAAALINLKPTPKVIEVLEGLADNAAPTVRAMALTVLVVSVGEPAREKYIRPRLQDQNAKVRETLLGLLGPVEDASWFSTVGDLCADTDREVRVRAIRIAKGIAAKNGYDDRMVRLMVDNLSNSNDGVRADAASVLGGLGNKETWRYLAPLLADSEANVRAAVAQSLVNLGVPESGDAIVNAMAREDDKWTRIYLAGAAQKLTLQKAIEPLISWLGDSNDEIKKVAEAALKAITGENRGDQRAWEEWFKGKSK